jgi:uroporphyrinogen-III decarboxylase
MLSDSPAAGRMITPGRYLACFAFLIAASLVSIAQAADGGVDAVLVMDSSGSMAKNDPHKLRVPAAKMFMSLLGEQDRIGLISFSDNGYPVLHLTAPGLYQSACRTRKGPGNA